MKSMPHEHNDNECSSAEAKDQKDEWESGRTGQPMAQQENGRKGKRGCMRRYLCDDPFEYMVMFIVSMSTVGFWIGTMAAAYSCGHIEGLPERGHLDAQNVVMAYGTVGFSALFVGTCNRFLPILRNGFVSIAVLGVYLGLCLWNWVAGVILETQHFDDQPFGLNVLVLMVLAHFVVFVSIGWYMVCRSIDPF
jgi:hypothetical protein